MKSWKIDFFKINVNSKEYFYFQDKQNLIAVYSSKFVNYEIIRTRKILRTLKIAGKKWEYVSMYACLKMYGRT